MRAVTTELSRGAAAQSIEELFQAALSRSAEAGETLVIALPAPAPSVDTALDVLWREAPHTVLWDPPGGPACVGSGVARWLEAGGPERFERLREQSERLWSQVVLQRHPETTHETPKLFGGLAFAPGTGEAQVGPDDWGELGEGAWWLPRWTWRCDEEGASLWFAAPAGAMNPAERDCALTELERIRAGLEAKRAPVAGADTETVSVAHVNPSVWRAQVRAASEAIAGGKLDKVVVARSATLGRGRVPFEPRAALARLRQHEGCTRFAFRNHDVTFLGATPERLLSKRGSQVQTEAMAGSAARGHANALVESAKDRREHELVVDAILERLSGISLRMQREPEPRVHAFRDVLHLDTPIRAEVSEHTHPLEIAAALHPTPAVAGLPGREALRWIAEREAVPRGWYSGPVGWIDARGDAEIAVALRSGLVSARRARVWAGAGIVAGSQPEAEYAETGLKMRAVLDALGADDADETGRGAEDGGAMAYDSSPTSDGAGEAP